MKYESNDYPFSCQNCERKVWLNPLPVVIVAVPVGGEGYGDLAGYLGHIRNNPTDPGYGKLAFASGYVEKHETWEEAGVREVKEEFNLDITGIYLDRLVSMNGFLCILARCRRVEAEAIDWTFTNAETQKLVLITNEAEELAFRVQTNYLRELPFPA